MRQRAAVHADGAGTEIAVENLLHIVVQQSIGLEQIGQRAVFAAVALFGVIDILVNSDALVSGQKPRQLQQALEALGIAAAVNERADHDCAHIDHGVDVSTVQRLVAGVDRVEGLAGGLDADAALHGLDAVVQQRLKQQDRLDHALDGKGLAAVSRPALLPIVADHIDAEHRRVCLGQLRDIICKTALRGIRQAFRQQAFKKLFHNRLPFVLRREQARR